MIQSSLFDYGLLDDETRTFVQEKTQSIHTRLKRTAEDIIAIGHDLIEVKERLGHGQFIPWLQSEFGMSRQTAHDFIRVAERFGDKCRKFLHLPVSVLYELAAPSTPDEVVEMVETGIILPTIPAIREAKREIQENPYKHLDDLTPVEEPVYGQYLEGVNRQETKPIYSPDDLPPNFGIVRTFDREEMLAKRQMKEDERELLRVENRQMIASASTIDEALKVAAFSTIVLDPPWDWGDEGDVDQFGRARPTYGTMTIDDIAALPVGTYAADDCHLYLWITNRSLPKGFRLLETWGFRYVTCITWVKPHFGMGNYFRGQTEQLLFGVKGSQPLKRKNAPTYFEAPRGPNGHSSKPLESYDFIESCSPGPYLELFARSQRPEWTSWGAEV